MCVFFPFLLGYMLEQVLKVNNYQYNNYQFVFSRDDLVKIEFYVLMNKKNDIYGVSIYIGLM